MKKKVILFTLLFIWTFQNVGFAVNVIAENEISQTTDIEILFLGIPWGSTSVDTISAVKQVFPAINSEKAEQSPGPEISGVMHKSYNYSDEEHRCFSYYESENVEVTSYKLENTISHHANYDYMGYVGNVAGHNVDSIEVRFIDSGNYGFFSACYSITVSEDDLISCIDRYQDIKDKLIQLYGNPFSYDISGHDIMGEKTGECSNWKGENGSAVTISYEDYSTGYLRGNGYIRINYGTTACNSIFIDADAKAEADTQAKIDDEKKAIANDNTGL